MDLGLKGKVAIVTGGSRGIGASIAAELAAEGVHVAVFDRLAAEAEAVVSRLASVGEENGHLAVEVDVSDSASIDAAFARTVETLGPLDALVCNAGITRDQVSWKMSDDNWRQVIDINLGGYFYCARAAGRLFKEQKHGRIVNITSINGLRGKFGQSNYAASKGGVIALTKTLARELGKFNVNVNAVAPGMVLTEMMSAVPPEFQATALAETVLGRFATPADVAELVVFLCSRRSRHITGEIIKVDGGQYI